MAEYKSNSSKSEDIPFELPSCPGSEVRVNKHLGYKARKRIRQESNKVQAELTADNQERFYETFDQAAAEYQCLVEALLDPRTTSNLTENGQPIQFSRYWIDFEMDERDANFLGKELFVLHQEALGIEPPVVSAEGEDEPQPEKKLSGRKKQHSEAGLEDNLPE